MNFRGTATDEEFVRHVQNNAILWDTRCQDYKDCKEKALVWDAVGNACGITGEQARLKWVSLREKYRREKLYWENIEKNGNSSNAPLKEYWPLMKDMKFIDAVSTKRHSYRKTIKLEKMGSSSMLNEGYSPNLSLTTSPNNFPSNNFPKMQLLEPLDNNEEQTHFLMNNSYNGMDEEDHSMDSDNGYNSLDINKTKYQSFGIYVGNELCSLRDEFAEELHERLLTELLKFKRELRQAKCAEM